MFSDLDNFHGVRAAGLAKRLADGQHNIVAAMHGAALEQLVFGHVQGPLRVARPLEHDRVNAAKQGHATPGFDHR